MKLYKHKAICEWCGVKEFEGVWIRFDKKPLNKKFFYICFRCIPKLEEIEKSPYS